MSSTPQSEIDEWINVTNKFRKCSGVNPVTWDPQLAKKAEDWLEHLTQNENGCMRHPGNSGSSKYGCKNPKTSAKANDEMNKYLTVPIKNSNKLLQFGQNLAWSEEYGNPNNKISGGSIENSITEWWKEGKFFNQDKPSVNCSDKCKTELHSDGLGHFTQLVWKDSNKIGCAYKEKNHGNGKVSGLWCCNYLPAGNIVNKDGVTFGKGKVGLYKDNCTQSQINPKTKSQTKSPKEQLVHNKSNPNRVIHHAPSTTTAKSTYKASTCGNCYCDDDCREGHYCCPYMKKCVINKTFLTHFENFSVFNTHPIIFLDFSFK